MQPNTVGGTKLKYAFYTEPENYERMKAEARRRGERSTSVWIEKVLMAELRKRRKAPSYKEKSR